MRAALCRIGLALTAALALSACGGGEPRLLNVGAGATTPDEFAILPGKPLQTPETYTDLPPPTPGGSNLTDPTPKADAIAALGGRSAGPGGPGIPVADGGLVSYTQRHGVQPEVRQQLAAADLAFRKRRDGFFLQKWFGRNRYFKAYRRQTLDQYLELARLRAAGIKTPSAPPKP